MSMSDQRLVTVRSSSSVKTAERCKGDPEVERRVRRCGIRSAGEHRGRDAQRDIEVAGAGWWRCKEAYLPYRTFVGLSGAAQLSR